MKRYMHEPLLGLIRPCNYGHWVRYEDAKARADMADSAMACIAHLEFIVKRALKGIPVRDADEALNFAAGLREEYDALKEG